MTIKEWLIEAQIQHQWEGEIVFTIEEKIYLYLEDREKLFDKEFQFILTDEEFDLAEHADYFAFKFGDKFYYSGPELELNPLRHIGKHENISEQDFPYLGIHGKYDILNGNRDYKDWCKKAKFLGYETLGICENQTLAGTMLFQQSCEQFDIKPIHGTQAMVKLKHGTFHFKFYAMNKKGWRNLIKINKVQNVDNAESEFGKHITDTELMKYSEGVVAVVTTEVPLTEWLVKKFKDNFEHVFYQFDLVEWRSPRKERETLQNIQDWLTNYQNLEPILISDSYYLDKIDSGIKKMLNEIGKIKFQNQSQYQYFKTSDELMCDGFEMFEDFEKYHGLFEKAKENVKKVGELCEFRINIEAKYLPQYEMNPDESEKYKDNMDLFWGKIQDGLERKVFGRGLDEDKYLERIQTEFEVLDEGGVIDYFLILSDICQWCDKNGVLRGHGRGSAGGSLISYCLDIIELDPIEYDLLFERFLNPGRLASGEFPDIDSDFSDRDAVVAYMEDKYGKNYVASVATYSNMKIKNAIKDFSRVYGVQAQTANFATGLISKKDEASDFTNIFRIACKEPKFRNFIMKYPKVFKDLDLVLFQTRTPSIHACATIIVPKVDEDGESVDIHDLVPTKLMDGKLVTEWEGAQLDKAGFLKEDILGLKQLEKFKVMIELIKENTGDDVNIFDIDLTNEDVFEYFHYGANEDVFQFGTGGLKAYCKGLKPDSVLELTAANALYRPGAMESNTHNKYVQIKHGALEPEFDYLLKDVTTETFGLYIYQEQIMKAYVHITDAPLIEGDKFRKFITKAYKLKAKGIEVTDDPNYNKYHSHFVDSYVEKGQTKKLAEEVWDKLVAFAGYGFNKSHAAAYSIIGYISQWLKWAYPIEFWTVSLQMAADYEIVDRLNELRKSSNIKIFPPDINKSRLGFFSDKEENEIYFSLDSIKHVGEIATAAITEERNQNGKFFDLKEFIRRVDTSKVNKRTVTNLILSGAFDKMYNIKVENDRFMILDEYYGIIEDKEKTINKYESVMNDKTFWQLIQHELCGFGDISYKQIVEKRGYKNFEEDIQQCPLDAKVSCAGIVEEFQIKKTKRGDEFVIIKMNCNDNIFNILCWNDVFEEFKEDILASEGKILILNGEVKYDDYNGRNSLYTNSYYTKVELL